jgi:hypothetical protein
VDEGFLRAWIRAHVEDAAKLRKPARPAAAGGLALPAQAVVSGQHLLSRVLIVVPWREL